MAPTPAKQLPTQRLSAKYLLGIAAPGKTLRAKLPSIDGASNVQHSRKSGIDVNSVVIIPWVIDIKWGATPTARVTYTQDAYVIERHPKGTRRRDVSISGIVGPTPFLVDDDLAKKISADNSALASLSGSYRAFLAVMELLDKWDQSDPDTTLNLYALNEGWYYRCIPKPLALSQGGRQRNMLRYDLGLQLLEKVNFTFTIDDVAATAGVVAEPTLKDKIQGIADTCRDGIEEFSNGMNAAMDVVNKGLHDYVTGPVYTVIRSVDEGIDAFQNMADTISTIANTPKVLWTRAQVSIRKAEAVGRSLSEQLESALSFSTRLADEPDPLSSALLANAASLEAIRQNANKLHVLSLTASTPDKSYRPRLVQQGDTIEGIALEVYGDATLWPLVVQQNSLVPPYISQAGLPGTVKPGETLNVQSGGTPTLATMSPPDVAKRDLRLYGRNIALTRQGDLRQAGSDDCADIALIDGVDCVEQAIWVKTSKVQGTDQLHPDGGIPAAIGRSNAITSKATLSLALYRAIAEDDRVARVDDFDVEDLGDAWQWKATPVLVGSEQLAQGGGVR